MNKAQTRLQLAEYRRLTGKGQMDRANLLMADIVETMLDASDGGGTHTGSTSPEFLAAPGGMTGFAESLTPPPAEQGMDQPVLAGEIDQAPDPDSPAAHEAAALTVAAAMIKRDKEEQKRLEEEAKASEAEPEVETEAASETPKADETGDKKSPRRK